MEFLNMSRKEIDRISILNKVREGLLTQKKAGELLEISDRQIRNLLRNFSLFGPEGVISKKRGKQSNNRRDSSVKSNILSLLSEKYEGFGPTLAAEKLWEYEKIQISRETVRKWMIETHLWVPSLKKRTTHPPRKRREFFGEMLQGDGYYHDWFENGNPCALLYFIDDSTNVITSTRFEPRESLMGYFEILKQHLEKYGIPHSIYTDRFSVFETARKKDNLTQLQRALKHLEIKWIGAGLPQAKGRIERCNRTLQDRLIKEMKLKGIQTIDAGNDFLKEYLTDFNNKFSKKPMKTENLHRPLEQGVDIHRTLSKYEERTLTKDLIFQFNHKQYKIFEPVKGFCLGKRIEIRTDRRDGMRVFMGNRELEFAGLDEIFENSNNIIKLDTSCPKKSSKPKFNHPWKQNSYVKGIREKEMKLYNGV